MTRHSSKPNKLRNVFKDKSSARSTFMPFFSKSYRANKQILYRPFSLIELKFHTSQMNNADASRFFRHVPSIKRACKFPIIGSFHCDNRTVYITNAWEPKNAATLKLTS